MTYCDDFRWHYRCIDLYSMLTDIEPGDLVFLSRVSVSQPIGKSVVVDEVSFKLADDPVVRALLEDESVKDTGRTTMLTG